MKIQPLSRFFNGVGFSRKNLVELNTQQEHPSQDHSRKEDQADEKNQELESNPEVNPEKLDQEIRSFQSDILSQNLGLYLNQEGHGPGLRIILKDPAGNVVRSFSEAEFLRLRQETSRDGRHCGKILDQKL